MGATLREGERLTNDADKATYLDGPGLDRLAIAQEYAGPCERRFDRWLPKQFLVVPDVQRLASMDIT
ncbi:hypothetical protein GCM10020258_52580 [Sphingomonas yabuuchiae]